MDFFVILVLVVFFKDGSKQWTDHPYGEDMQTCHEELAALKAEKMSHPDVKSVVAYCVTFAPTQEAKG